MKQFLRGIYDSCSIHRIIVVLYCSNKLRKYVYRSIIINLLLYLTSAIVTEKIFLMLLEKFLGEAGYFNCLLHMIVYIFLMYPVYIVISILSIFWNNDISKETNKMVSNVEYKNPNIWLILSGEILSNIIIGLYLIQIFILSHIPYIGDLLTIIQTSWFWSVSSYEYKYSLEGLNIMNRIKIYEYNWEYMLGFGIIPSLLSFYTSKYIGLAILSMLFPFFIITSIMSDMEINVDNIKLPIFYLPNRINKYMINKMIKS